MGPDWVFERARALQPYPTQLTPFSVPLPLPPHHHAQSQLAMRPTSTAGPGPRRATAGAACITLFCLLSSSCLGLASASSSPPSLLKRWTQTFGLGGATKALEFVDSWATQPDLRVLSKMMDGDRCGVVSGMANDKGLEEIWSKSWAFHRMLQSFPMLEGIKGFAKRAKRAATRRDDDDGAPPCALSPHQHHSRGMYVLFCVYMY
jgi:hypothetical protein